MRRRLARAAAAAAAGLVVLLASPAEAADDSSIGWLRVSPTTGTLDTPVNVLTQAQCPAGEAVVVSLTGPKIPAQGDLGYLVGNTAIAALPDTGTGQLYVPLALTIESWFGRNVPGVRPEGTYTITLICRDKLRSSKTYGSYVAKLAISSAGTYKALGEAAKPIGIQVGSADPFAEGVVTAEPTPEPTASGEASPTTAPTSSGAESSPPSEEPAPGEPAVTSEPGQGATQAAGAATAPLDSGPGSWPLVLALSGCALVVGAFVVNRRRNAHEPIGAREAPREHANR